MSKTLTPQTSHSSETWGGLRKAIASTPGFQHWCSNGHNAQEAGLDELIQSYLRETLETLAY
jgi:hypothetical protein